MSEMREDTLSVEEIRWIKNFIKDSSDKESIIPYHEKEAISHLLNVERLRNLGFFIDNSKGCIVRPAKEDVQSYVDSFISKACEAARMIITEMTIE